MAIIMIVHMTNIIEKSDIAQGFTPMEELEFAMSRDMFARYHQQTATSSIKAETIAKKSRRAREPGLSCPKITICIRRQPAHPDYSGGCSIGRKFHPVPLQVLR